MENFLINSVQAVTLPTIGGGQDLPSFISSIYSFSLTIVGIAVFVQMVRAGFMWLTAAGNVGKAGTAKSMMTNAVIGAILLFAAYLILFIINPDLVKNTFDFTIPRSGPSSLTNPLTKTGTTNGPAQIRGTPFGGTASLFDLVKSARAAGIYSFSLESKDAAGNSCAKTYTMEIFPLPTASGVSTNKAALKESNPKGGLPVANAASECSVVSLEADSIPDAFEDVPYYVEISAKGGAQPYVYTITGGGLPPGIDLVADTPPAAYIGSAYFPTGTSPEEPGSGLPSRSPTPTPTAGVCIETGIFPSTCPSSGYTWLQNGEICASSTNAGDQCSSDSYCASISGGSTCYAVSEGGCRCVTGSRLGACCQAVNPKQYATIETANTLAACLGGSVYSTTLSLYSSPTQYHIKFSSGAILNAGLLADRYNKYDKALADSWTYSEVNRNCP
ncbi:MAG: hypothetical protein HY506_01125 [Candidatus Yanofskybacteria bacterium]|nr:hypothetical protein [Candidatus Yanofskybacteria bacterium]